MLNDNVFDWRPWEHTIRVVGMRFGAGLAGYFEFARWLFLLNTVLFTLWFFFLVVPQRVLPDDPANAVRAGGMCACVFASIRQMG